ncbi:uncharacterized protein C16orf95 homolog [Balaenoptera acutorostrata]|uniref:Uncharacterized protein C16orf95 homolog n=1 Tax=Balaenoptera acutorostrata TaxID=9767 RepID=A0ABM3SKS4_BALAC|nr:uncharacterized protein C16orf95 homolog [Balaenoptera acutorostrata]
MCPAPSSVHREPICCECQAKFGGRLPVRRAEAVLPYWVPLSLTPKAEWIHHCTFPPAKDESSHFCASSPALGIDGVCSFLLRSPAAPADNQKTATFQKQLYRDFVPGVLLSAVQELTLVTCP